MSRSNILNDLPLAWLQLKRQPVKYLVAIAGIGFAALLMYMQIVIIRIADQFDNILRPRMQILFTSPKFSEQRQLQSISSVSAV